MRKFVFRLQRVLEFRESQEAEAKLAYVSARARHLEAEREAGAIRMRHDEALQTSLASLPELVTLDAYLERLEDEERAQRVIVQVLVDEEEQMLEQWRDARREAEALRKLRERDERAYWEEAARKEQNEMDELAIRRYAA